MNSTKFRLLAAVPLIAAAVLVHVAAPAAAAGTVPETVGMGKFDTLIGGGEPSTLACQSGETFVYHPIYFEGVALGHNDNPLRGGTEFHNPPVGTPTSDPLNGTPLGCDPAAIDGSIAVALTGPSGAVPGNGAVPLISCPGAQSTCAGGPSQSNALASEGTVSGAHNGNFNCESVSNLLGNTPTTSRITCDLHGSYVRYGETVLMALTGCFDVIPTAGAECLASSGTEDVAVVMQLVPFPAAADCVEIVVTGAQCRFGSGQYLVTPHGSVAGLGGPVQTALDALYCPLGPGHVPGRYPPDPSCA